MAIFRRAWFGPIVAAMLAIACGSFAAAQACPAAAAGTPAAMSAMPGMAGHAPCSDHGSKNDSAMPGCIAGCAAILAEASIARPSTAAPMPLFAKDDPALTQAPAGLDPPPPRAA
jgi:hypothetical protein